MTRDAFPSGASAVPTHDTEPGTGWSGSAPPTPASYLLPLPALTTPQVPQEHTVFSLHGSPLPLPHPGQAGALILEFNPPRKQESMC